MSADVFKPELVKSFKPFEYGACVFGGHFGDEGKGKIIDIISTNYQRMDLKILSIRGQGSGNAGHTVIVNGKSYDFHYLTSAGLSADIMLLGPGMLIDPIRVLNEAQKLPENKRNIIMIAERATISCELDRSMDAWLENKRKDTGKPVIGTTKSGVGPCTGWRSNRDHVTFADAIKCQSSKELYDLFKSIPNVPKEVFTVMTLEYAEELFEAIRQLNIVDSNKIISDCRYDRKNTWAILLEVSQGMSLDPLFGNGGHFVTSTPCSDIGAAAFAGLTMHDFPDGTTMVLKAYSSKVGEGPFVTCFSESEYEIANYIYDTVGECGVTTGRKRSLGWFDGPAVRMAIQNTGAKKICINCMDVIGQLPGNVAKVCYAYKNKYTGEVHYNLPYNLNDYEPLYIEVPVEWDCYKAKTKNQLNDSALNYIHVIENVIGAKVTYIGTGGSREDIIRLY